MVRVTPHISHLNGVNYVCILNCLSGWPPCFGSFIQGKANGRGACGAQLTLIKQMVR